MMIYKEYNTNQLSLELNLAYDIPMTHEARLISLFVDSIPHSVLLEVKSYTGRPAFHPAMLLKMTLFAYARQVFSGRKMVQMNEEVIPMKWLSQDTYVSYKTITNCRSSKHANLYSFTWKKAVEKYDAALNGNSSELYDKLIQEGVGLTLSKEERETSEELKTLLEKTEEALDDLEKAISEEPKVIKGGSANKQKRRRIKKRRNQLKKDVIPRKQRYEEARAILQERNSFSKTDHDATFMRMKEDHMSNGQLKPGYNVQAATNGQYVLAYDIFPNPTDTRTLKPFLESIQTLDLFQNIVADAGYGNEENYSFIIDELEKTPLIPYSMYQKEGTNTQQKSKIASTHPYVPIDLSLQEGKV